MRPALAYSLPNCQHAVPSIQLGELLEAEYDGLARSFVLNEEDCLTCTEEVWDFPYDPWEGYEAPDFPEEPLVYDPYMDSCLWEDEKDDYFRSPTFWEDSWVYDSGYYLEDDYL